MALLPFVISEFRLGHLRVGWNGTPELIATQVAMAGLGVQPGGGSIGDGRINVLGIEDGRFGCVVHKVGEKVRTSLVCAMRRPDF
jgi:hypothetical protein